MCSSGERSAYEIGLRGFWRGELHCSWAHSYVSLQGCPHTLWNRGTSADRQIEVFAGEGASYFKAGESI
jgi:hypothetical protein